MTGKLLQQGYRYHKLRKYFTNFYHRNSDLILKFNCNRKTLLRLDISKPDFYRDVVYKLVIVIVLLFSLKLPNSLLKESKTQLFKGILHVWCSTLLQLDATLSSFDYI
jgi:hypothetical protein